MRRTTLWLRSTLRGWFWMTLVMSTWPLGCGGKVVVDLVGGAGGTGGDGGSGGSGTGTALDGGACQSSMDAGAGQFRAMECFTKPEKGCPKQYDAVQFIVPTTPCVYLVSVDCGPFASGSQCCYMVTEEVKPCN